MLYSKIQKLSIYKTNETLKIALLYFRSKRLLSLHKYRLQHLYIKGKTNLGGEGETEVKQGVEVILVNLTIPYYIITIAHRLE